MYTHIHTYTHMKLTLRTSPNVIGRSCAMVVDLAVVVVVSSLSSFFTVQGWLTLFFCFEKSGSVAVVSAAGMRWCEVPFFVFFVPPSVSRLCVEKLIAVLSGEKGGQMWGRGRDARHRKRAEVFPTEVLPKRQTHTLSQPSAEKTTAKKRSTRRIQARLIVSCHHGYLEQRKEMWCPCRVGKEVESGDRRAPAHRYCRSLTLGWSSHAAFQCTGRKRCNVRRSRSLVEAGGSIYLSALGRSEAFCVRFIFREVLWILDLGGSFFVLPRFFGWPIT